MGVITVLLLLQCYCIMSYYSTHLESCLFLNAWVTCDVFSLSSFYEVKFQLCVDLSESTMSAEFRELYKNAVHRVRDGLCDRST